MMPSAYIAGTFDITRHQQQDTRTRIGYSNTKGSSIYDDHKKNQSFYPSVRMRPHETEPRPPCGRPHAVGRNAHHSAETASTMTFQT